MSDLSFLSDYVVLNDCAGSSPFTGLTLHDLLVLVEHEGGSMWGDLRLYKRGGEGWLIDWPSPSIDWVNPLDNEDTTLLPKLVHKNKLKKVVASLYDDCFTYERIRHIKRRKALRQFLLDNGTSEKYLCSLETKYIRELKAKLDSHSEATKKEIERLQESMQRNQTLLDACNPYFKEG